MEAARSNSPARSSLGGKRGGWVARQLQQRMGRGDLAHDIAGNAGRIDG